MKSNSADFGNSKQMSRDGSKRHRTNNPSNQSNNLPFIHSQVDKIKELQSIVDDQRKKLTIQDQEWKNKERDWKNKERDWRIKEQLALEREIAAREQIRASGAEKLKLLNIISRMTDGQNKAQLDREKERVDLEKERDWYRALINDGYKTSLGKMQSSNVIIEEKQTMNYPMDIKTVTPNMNYSQRKNEFGEIKEDRKY